MKEGIGSFAPCKKKDTFICVCQKSGAATITIQKDAKEARLDLLGVTPFMDGKPHPEKETLNDGKVAPDGKFFAGTVDNDNVFGIKDESLKKFYWTMEGDNQLAPLLYRFDLKEKVVVP